MPAKAFMPAEHLCQLSTRASSAMMPRSPMKQGITAGKQAESPMLQLLLLVCSETLVKFAS